METPSTDINLIKQVTTLIADFRNLKESQDNFHREMKEAISDLKNNYSTRLDDHDKRLSNLEITRVDFREKMSANKQYLLFISALGVLIVGLIIFHLTGYSI